MATISGVGCNPQLVSGFKSSANYSSAATNLFMYVTDDMTLTTAGADTKAIGIRMNKPNIGEAVEFAIGGTALLKIGSGGCTQNDYLKSDASGQGVVAGTTKDIFCAIALQDGAEGDEIMVLVCIGVLNI